MEEGIDAFVWDKMKFEEKRLMFNKLNRLF